MPRTVTDKTLDCETAALFRAFLFPILDRSASWRSLTRNLRDKGYELALQEGRLVLLDRDSGARLCFMRALGLPLADLVARLGRPHIRPLPGPSARGVILEGL